MKLAKHAILLLSLIMLAGCNESPRSNAPTSDAHDVLPPARQTSAALSTSTITKVSPLSAFGFPATIDPEADYLFYLHGKIIEDQGLPAVSAEYGEYQYIAILEALQGYDYVVISEQRATDTDSLEYARRVAGQVTLLLVAGVKPEHITVVGASKGAGIAIYISQALANRQVNYVLLSICHPDNVQALIDDGITLYGNVLSIYDASDTLAGSCQELASYSQDKGLSDFEELVLQVGTGHGILYQPLLEWVLPTVEWGRQH
jgi:hypothetical protein